MLSASSSMKSAETILASCPGTRPRTRIPGFMSSSFSIGESNTLENAEPRARYRKRRAPSPVLYGSPCRGLKEYGKKERAKCMTTPDASPQPCRSFFEKPASISVERRVCVNAKNQSAENKISNWRPHSQLCHSDNRAQLL